MCEVWMRMMRMHFERRLLGFAVMALGMSLLGPVGGFAQTGSRTFSETGRTVSGKFLDYWDRHGGLQQQGYPVSEELEESSDTDGRPYRVQYFERAVFELHPENRPPYNVLLSQLGTYRYRELYVAAPRGGGSSALVYELPNMDQVRVRQDVTYKTAAGRDLKLDAYYPPD